MNKIPFEIMKTLIPGRMSFRDVWEKIGVKEIVGKPGMNVWNFRKALEKLVALGYVFEDANDGLSLYFLSVKGELYLETIKKAGKF